MIYAMSDIHGCIKELKRNMEKIDLRGENRIIFLGDYIDYGEASCQVLQYIRELQKQLGSEKVIVLKGNHEQMFLEWINDFRDPYVDGSGDCRIFNDWLRTDFEYGANTIRTFISEKQLSFLEQISKTCSLETISLEAVQMVLSNHGEMIDWIQSMPSYYETGSQIFVHAGVDEEEGEYIKQMNNITIRFNEISEAVSIMKEVAAWGRGQGFRVWPDEWLTPEELITPDAQPENFCIGSIDGETVCAFILQWTDSAYWPDAPRYEAAYLHKFCVRRKFAGRGITGLVTEALRTECRRRGVPYIRLDTGLDERKIRKIYLDAGFKIVNIIDYPNGRSLALYEMEV